MSPFNIFRAFSGSSRNNNPGRHVGRHRSRRSKIVKRRREHVVEQEYVPDEVVPWSAIFSTAENHDVGCYGPGYYNTADIYHPQPTRPPSPIPAVYRQDSHSRLHEDYLLSNQQRTFSADGYDTTSWREVEGARWQIPVKVNSSSVGSSERIRSGRYQEAEDLHPKGYHSFPYDSSSNLGHQSQLPTFVRVGDDKKVIIHRYDGSRNAWDERTHSHSSDSIRAYYIVPPGVSVIFEDEDGNEITRVGDFNSRTRHSSRHPNPFIIQDEDGHELYRSRSEKSSATSYSSNLSDDTSYGNCRHRMHHNSRFHHEAHSDPLQEPYEDQRNIRSNHVPSSNFSSLRPTYSFILIDGEGRQIPIRLNGHEFT